MKKIIYILSQTITLFVFLGLVVLLFLIPEANSLIWTFVIPFIPITLLIIGYNRWRNICPLAWFSKVTQNINIFSKRKAHPWFEQNVYMFQFSILFIAFAARLYALNSNASLLAGFFILVIVLVLLSGLFLSGKSWCNYFCPVGVVEKIYSVSSSKMNHINSACGTCTACKKNCPDIDMESSYWKEASNKQKKAVFYAFPGLVFGFYLYYYLEAGNWAYYFDGSWAFAKTGETLTTTLMLPGFFFLPLVPKLLAVPVTLLVTSVISFYIFAILEKLIGHTTFAKTKEATSVEHITKSFAAFIAFNIFYIFAGAPTFSQYPYLYTGLHFIVIVVSSVLLWKEIYREEKFYVQERFARRILKKLKGEDLSGKNLKEIYYTYANQEKDHKQHLQNYKETMLELLSDGTLSAEDTKILDKIRNQLGITLQEHKKIMKSLEHEYAQLFDKDTNLTSEKLFQLKTYKTMLKKKLDENEALDEKEFEQMRKNFDISADEHSNILNELVNKEGIIINRVLNTLNELLGLYKINSALALNYSVSIDYLKFNINESIKNNILSLEKIIPLACSNDDISKLLRVLQAESNITKDISFKDENINTLVKEILLYKNKEFIDSNDGLKEAALYIFKSESKELIPSLLLVLLIEKLQTEFEDEIEKYISCEDGVVSEIANMLLNKKASMSTIHKEAFLHAVSIFKTLSPEYIETLAQNAVLRSYNKGEYLVKQGEKGDSLYIITKGKAKVLMDLQQQGIKEVAEVNENDYIGEIAIFSGEKRIASVQAIEKVEALEVSVDTIKKIIYHNPDISFDIIKQITTRLLSQK